PCSISASSHISQPLVLGVHVQLLTVQLRQLGEGFLDAVQVLDGLPKGGQHLLAMGTHLGVAQDGRGAGQVPKVVKEPLGPGVDDQQPGRDTSTDMLKLHAQDTGPSYLPLPLPSCAQHRPGRSSHPCWNPQGAALEPGAACLDRCGASQTCTAPRLQTPELHGLLLRALGSY
uniref:Uncharacterized protein n=1 Tax=Ficedula albicollis TaxID=59894 RepID=A0A803VZE3_FICAL